VSALRQPVMVAAMSEQPSFEISVYQNKYLPEGHRVMDAVISVSTADGGARGEPALTAAQVIMIDCSGSMGGEKIAEAKRATTAAVDLLRDGVAFAVVAGTTHARMVYPAHHRMALAAPTTKDEARAAIRQLLADGGTAIGSWLELANTLLAGQAAQVKHAILLTDGHNLHQQPHELDATLERCRSRFVCDSRGVGKDWSAKPLRAIADALHGSAGGLPDARALSQEFRAMTDAFMSISVANVALRVWHPRGARIRFLGEVYPHSVDITDRRLAVTEKVGDYPIGSWGAEIKDYHLSVELPPGDTLFEEVLCALVSIIADEQELAKGLVRAIWTDDVALSTKVNEGVAHYTGQIELDHAIQQGLDARQAGRVVEATARLGRAVQLAAESQRHDTLKLLDKVVDVVDASTAKVRLRAGIEQVDAEMAALSTRKTVPWRKARVGSQRENPS